MSQTIQGKTTSGQLIDIHVDDQGNLTVSNPDGSAINGGKLVTEDFDYIAASYPDADTEVYTYKEGGSGGTTVAVVTVNYTDSTKANMLNIART